MFQEIGLLRNPRRIYPTVRALVLMTWMICPRGKMGSLEHLTSLPVLKGKRG